MEKRQELKELLFKMWSAFASEVDIRNQDTIRQYVESQDRIYEILADSMECSSCVLAKYGRRITL